MFKKLFSTERLTSAVLLVSIFCCFYSFFHLVGRDKTRRNEITMADCCCSLYYFLYRDNHTHLIPIRFFFCCSSLIDAVLLFLVLLLNILQVFLFIILIPAVLHLFTSFSSSYQSSAYYYSTTFNMHLFPSRALFLPLALSFYRFQFPPML